MAGPRSFDSSSGIRVAASARGDTDGVVSELKSGLGHGAFQHIIVFFAVEHDAHVLAAGLGAAFPGIPISGCSTAGEIATAGMTQGGAVALAFPEQGFRVLASPIENLDGFGVERVTGIARALKARLSRPGGDPRMGDRVFALMLVDGLSNCEEMLVAAVHWAIDDVQLVGGSAGDGLAFHETALISDGRVIRNAAILFMIEADVPFRVFKTQTFEPTATKLVVTAADTEKRIVHEFNAEPAAQEYAGAIGLLLDDLGPFSFASHPLVVKVGGDYYCRSIRNMNPDGSLAFFCAIDEGLVLTVARPKDMVQSTAATLSDVSRLLSGVDFVLGFDCVLRRLDAENRQIGHQLEDLYRANNVVGFHTYGEQYNAMHLNQTLTGIAFGHRSPRL